MLRELRIENLVLARQVSLPIVPGLCLITGETGAGKSLIVNALALCLGGRGESGLVRQGQDRAVVEALFDLSARPEIGKRAAGAGIDVEDDEFLVRREVGADGRSKAYVNGSSVTLSMLRSVTEGLVELHGQHEAQVLLQPDVHRELLDRYGDHDKLLLPVLRAHNAVREAVGKLDDLRDKAKNRDARLELIRFQLDEFDKLAPDPDEEDSLRRDRARLRHGEQIGEALQGSLELIYEGEEAAIDRLHQAVRRLRAQEVHDPVYGELAERLDEAQTQIAEVTAEIRSAIDDVAHDPQRLEQIEERLHAIERLRRRFDDVPLSEVCVRVDALRREVELLENEESATAELVEQLAKARASYTRAAKKLTKAREAAAGKLSQAVGGLLHQLAMPTATLDVAVETEVADSGDFVSRPEGLDRVELMLQANPGEPARPLRKVASGGELSRLMLALDIALEGGLPRRTLLFDEVDQGLGGDTADKLGEFLTRLAAHHQVICVTHLPQVAARAEQHESVAKKVKSGRTVAVVKSLEHEQDRVEELARMLGGRFVTDTARRHAEAMIRADPGTSSGSKRVAT